MLFLNFSIVRLLGQMLPVATAEQDGAHVCMNNSAATEQLQRHHMALSTFLC